jgi:tetratricopeptide (TPR) repeat protein
MKTDHSNKNHTSSDSDWLSIAEAREREGELTEAATAYEKMVKAYPLNEKAYNRLMRIYRQLKEYKKELKIINAAINAFEESYNKKHRSPGKKITRLSKALQKATGLTDKKGKEVYQPDPLARWKKRKMTVMKRLKKQEKV